MSQSITYAGTITASNFSGLWIGTPISPLYGGIGSIGLGSPLQQIRINGGGTAFEYFTPPSGLSLSSLTGGASNNSIDNGGDHSWSWNSLNNTKGFLISSNSQNASVNAQRLFNVELSGANTNSSQITYAASISNTHTGTSSTNIALNLSASGGTINRALNIAAGEIALNSSAGTSGQVLKSQGANATPIWAVITPTRTVTGADAIVQTDENGLITFNSATPFNFTIDTLTIGTIVNFLNKGAGTVNFVNGAGVTYSGAGSLVGGINATGTIIYDTATTPIIISSVQNNSITRSVFSISSNTTGGSTAGIDYVYKCTNTFTFTLPTAVGNTNVYTIKNVGSGEITVNTTSSQTIDGDLTWIIPTNVSNILNGKVLVVVSDGANWMIIG